TGHRPPKQATSSRSPSLTVTPPSLSMAVRIATKLFAVAAFFGCGRVTEGSWRNPLLPVMISRQCGYSVPRLKARTSMVDGFPYKEEVGGSSPSVPTISKRAFQVSLCWILLRRQVDNQVNAES